VSCLFVSCLMCHVCLSYVGTGWRRLIGSPKLQIILHKRATKYRALLRKITYKDKGSYESSPPCMFSKTCLLDQFSVVKEPCKNKAFWSLKIGRFGRGNLYKQGSFASKNRALWQRQ